MGEIQDYNNIMKTALIAGGTGLIGIQVLELLLSSDKYKQVIALTRKDLNSHPKLVQVKFQETPLQLEPTWRIDDVFCCLGTTMAKAKSKEKFYRVDFTYPLELARASLALGAQQFLIVSSLGAQKNSLFYYNRVKGEIEEAVSRLGFLCVHIFRPSLLLGDRAETRSGEQVAKFFYRIFGSMIPKNIRRSTPLKLQGRCFILRQKMKKGSSFTSPCSYRIFD
jgi:uncharacterized protein YbjT (DUF2867 family)